MYFWDTSTNPSGIIIKKDSNIMYPVSFIVHGKGKAVDFQRRTIVNFQKVSDILKAQCTESAKMG